MNDPQFEIERQALIDALTPISGDARSVARALRDAFPRPWTWQAERKSIEEMAQLYAEARQRGRSGLTNPVRRMFPEGEYDQFIHDKVDLARIQLVKDRAMKIRKREDLKLKNGGTKGQVKRRTAMEKFLSCQESARQAIEGAVERDDGSRIVMLSPDQYEAMVALANFTAIKVELPT